LSIQFSAEEFLTLVIQEDALKQAELQKSLGSDYKLIQNA
jgi:hypothetical protein